MAHLPLPVMCSKARVTCHVSHYYLFFSLRLWKKSRVFVIWYIDYQALKICLEWSSEAIFFPTHHFELIYHKIPFKWNRINSLITKSLRIFFLEDIFFTIVRFWRFCPSKNLFWIKYIYFFFFSITFFCLFCDTIDAPKMFWVG